MFILLPIFSATGNVRYDLALIYLTKARIKRLLKKIKQVKIIAKDFNYLEALQFSCPAITCYSKATFPRDVEFLQNPKKIYYLLTQKQAKHLSTPMVEVSSNLIVDREGVYWRFCPHDSFLATTHVLSENDLNELYELCD